MSCCLCWVLGVLPGLPGLPSSSPSLFSWRLCFLRLAFLLGRFAGASSSDSSDSSDSLSDSSPGHGRDHWATGKVGCLLQGILLEPKQRLQGDMRSLHAGSPDISSC